MNLFKSLFGSKKESMRVEDCLVRQINTFSRRVYIPWSELLSSSDEYLEEPLSMAEGEDHLKYIYKWSSGGWEKMLRICIRLDLEDNARWIIKNHKNDIRYIKILTDAIESEDFKYFNMLIFEREAYNPLQSFPLIQA